MTNKINSLIGSDISINGDIVYEGTVHIESNITGSLTAYKDKKSKLYINKSSVINGNIIRKFVREGTYWLWHIICRSTY